MLEAFYRTEVKQRIQVMLARDGPPGEDMPKFIEKMTSMTIVDRVEKMSMRL